MEDESQAEHVTYWVILSLHVLDIDDLRSHIARSSTPDKQVFISVAKLCQPEVSNYEVATAWCSENQIFRLEISVHGFFVVHFLESTQDGPDNFLDLMGLVFFLGLDLVMK